MSEYNRVDSVNYSAYLWQFRNREVKLYTKKNCLEFVELTKVADVKRYCNRLYIKSIQASCDNGVYALVSKGEFTAIIENTSNTVTH